ncbi:Alkylated DNA repair protein alkB 8 [Geranomyces variabilis]|uniref:Alkylated DNA repair protein alkB 8 n=1 Tax=Geranomyces variabilis TaxID=109894 RepID=A0AAD5XRA5_9FUNG|nr:Alkylated DNA repair protein alkB 8 [Geranomyces variabilis]
MSSTTARKGRSKLDRQLEIFARFEHEPVDVLTSTTPTPFLLILNAGSTGSIGGIAGHDLEAACKVYPGFRAIEMLLGRPYSYALFDTAQHAAAAYAGLKDVWIPMTHGNAKRLLLAFATRMSPDVALWTPAEVALAVPGLTVVPGFVSPAEETAILSSLANSQQESAWTTLGKRRVRHFGYRFDYIRRTVDRDTSAAEPMPSWAERVIAAYGQMFPDADIPDQLTVNEYEPGSSIPPHTDTHSAFGDAILSVSLQGDVVMEFRCPIDSGDHVPSTSPSAEDGNGSSNDSDVLDAALTPPPKHTRFRVVNVHLPARSLLIMDGDARYQWEHSIRPRRTDVVRGQTVSRTTRVSLTFRSVKHEPRCEGCPWPRACDLAK